MVDLSDKMDRSESEEVINKYPDGVSSEESQASEVKRCADCGTSKTPLWRGGPAGPKSLCNACGIRSRKKRRAILGLKTDDKKTTKKMINDDSMTSSSSTTSSISRSRCKMGSPLHQRLIALHREVMMMRSTANNQRRRTKLGEEEQAAVLLMALSYGSPVYA